MSEDKCRVTGRSVFHRYGCDFGPDCPAPAGAMSARERDDRLATMGTAVDGQRMFKTEGHWFVWLPPSPRRDGLWGCERFSAWNPRHLVAVWRHWGWSRKNF